MGLGRLVRQVQVEYKVQLDPRVPSEVQAPLDLMVRRDLPDPLEVLVSLAPLVLQALQGLLDLKVPLDLLVVPEQLVQMVQLELPE